MGRILLLVAAGLLVAVLLDRVSLSPTPPGEPEATEAPRGGAASPETAFSLEAHPGRVVDAAGAIANYASALEWQTEAWHEDLGVDFHVVTVADRRLESDELASRLMTERGVGRDAPTGGLLLLVNPARREARLEVSYDLEGALPDALVGRLAETQLAPYAASAALGMALADTLHLLKDVLIVQTLRGRFTLAADYRARPSFTERAGFLSGGAGARVEIPDAAALAGRNLKATVPAGTRGRYAPSPQPIRSVEAFLRATKDLAGDPTLPLFTPGSRCMKAYYPFAPYEQLERASRLEASRPWRVERRGDRAVVTSESSVHGMVPVLLHRIDGTWRVDEVETWKNLFYDGRGIYRLKNTNTPYAFGLAPGPNAQSAEIDAIDLGSADPQTVVDALDTAGGPLESHLAGEILFRNCFLPDPALVRYERAAAGSGFAPMFVETLGDRAAYVGFRASAIRAYRKLGRHGFTKLAWLQQADGDRAGAEVSAGRAVERDPFDVAALATLQRALEGADRVAEAAKLERRVDRARRDPARRQYGLQLTFRPDSPALNVASPTRVGATRVYDHSYFEARLTNRSRHPVTVTELKLTTVGTGKSSGLGDIRGYFGWREPNRLGPGESVAVERTWGFTIDTTHDQLSYVFDYCWQGDGDPRQCRTERLDLMAPPVLRVAADAR